MFFLTNIFFYYNYIILNITILKTIKRLNISEKKSRFFLIYFYLLNQKFLRLIYFFLIQCYNIHLINSIVIFLAS